MLENLKISTKIISTPVLVRLIGICLSIHAPMQMKRIDTEYLYLIA